MAVRNVHRRPLPTPEDVRRVRDLLDRLGTDQDRLWPRDRWPALRLDRPLQVGARGGHGPVRYWVEHYEPGRRVRFRFERPRGFHGFHEFHVVAEPAGAGELAHVLEMRLSATARLTWPLLFRPLHDALIEQALDNACPEPGGRRAPPPWSAYVRVLRRVLASAPLGGSSPRRRDRAGASRETA